jgi:hypothetical protein
MCPRGMGRGLGRGWQAALSTDQGSNAWVDVLSEFRLPLWTD